MTGDHMQLRPEHVKNLGKDRLKAFPIKNQGTVLEMGKQKQKEALERKTHKTW